MPSAATVATDPVTGFPRGRAREGHAEGPDMVSYPYLEYFYHFVGCVFGGSRHSELKKHFFAESATMYK